MIALTSSLNGANCVSNELQASERGRFLGWSVAFNHFLSLRALQRDLDVGRERRQTAGSVTASKVSGA
jgi:hypothetical protein